MDQNAGADGSADPEGAIPSLFQPLPAATEASFSITAAHAGVDINDETALQAWMLAQVTTRQDVLQTLRNFHVAVTRPEVYHMIAQVENFIAKLDDRMLQLQDNTTGWHQRTGQPKTGSQAQSWYSQASIPRWSQLPGMTESTGC